MDTQPIDGALWRALTERQPLGGYYGVISTGIYCRFGCPSRPPKRENAVFFQSIDLAESSGFRACKRCKPA